MIDYHYCALMERSLLVMSEDLLRHLYLKRLATGTSRVELSLVTHRECRIQLKILKEER
jgi:hypothetical protein